MNLVGYCRVSSEEQATQGVSLPAQREKIAAYASLNEHDLIDTLADEGISGKKTENRPALQSCLAKLKRGEAQGLVVIKLDRLSRSTRDVLELVEEFDRNKWTLHSIGEQLDTSSAVGRFVVTVFAALAQMEREQVAERTKMAFAHKRKNQQKTGGYVKYGWQVGARGVLEKNDEQQYWISQMVKWRLRGMAYAAIARDLNAHGAPTASGKGVWTHVQVSRVVSDVRSHTTGPTRITGET